MEPAISKARPSNLTRPADLPMKYYDRNALGRLPLRLSESDGMYSDNPVHYLGVGASALNIIRGMQQLAAAPDFRSILDFGSGAGRVTRWLRVAYPGAAITAADIRAGDLEFCRDAFQVATWNSGTNVERMTPPGSFDLIWAGSVVTHLPAFKTVALFARFLSWLKPDGMLVASFHGPSAFSRRHELAYIEPQFLPKIESEFASNDYGYSDYRGQAGYGIAFCTPAWMLELAKQLPSARLIALSEKVWDNHHDIVALQKQ
jgi:SAM-dependent methyltransferase